MNALERKEKILEVLSKKSTPTSATSLANECGVSRQIIVGDIALLRASGESISATPRGYVLEQPSSTHPGELIRQIACIHESSQAELELQICIDNGCKVLDVIVEHPLYGQLIGQLQLSSRYDISQFIKKLEEPDIHSLSELTNGIHLHTIVCPDEDAYERVCAELEKQGILFKETV